MQEGLSLVTPVFKGNQDRTRMFLFAGQFSIPQPTLRVTAGRSVQRISGRSLPSDVQGFQTLPRQLPEVLFLSSVPVSRGRATHILRVAFKDSLERLFRTAVWTRISSCLSSSGACPALLFLPLPQSSAPDPQALFGGVASSFHSGSAGTVCRPQKSIGTRAERLSMPGPCGTLLSVPFLAEAAPTHCLPAFQRRVLSRPMPRESCSPAAILL